MPRQAPYPPALLDQIRARVPLGSLVGRDVRLVRRGAEFAGLCPFHQERHASFTVVEKRGFFHCFGCGAHGDAFGYVMRAKGLDFPAAVQSLAAEYGVMLPGRNGPVRDKASAAPPPPSPQEEDSQKARKIDRARALLAGSLPAAGSPAERYWRARGLTIPMPASLRFAARCDYFHEWADADGEVHEARGVYPALLAPIKRPAPNGGGAVIGVHRTYLTPDCGAKAPVASAKKILGLARGGAIRLSRLAPQMMIGEGIETTISGAAPFWDAARGIAIIDGVETGIWAAIDLGNLAGAGWGEGAPHPNPRRPGQRLESAVPDPARPGILLPPEIASVIILKDADSRDPATADCQYRRAAARFRDLERRLVRLAEPDVAGADFNDIAMGLA